jgi:pyroglutamyl-peptidase
MATVLVTGFEPFADFRNNPSAQVAEQLHGRIIGGASVESLILPVAFGQDTAKLFPVIEEQNPQLVLSLGLSPRATSLHIERTALNLRQGDGEKKEIPVVDAGPAAYFASIDVDAISAALRSRNIPATPHVYAGTFLCNHVMYQVLHLAATRNLSLPSGFIHIPFSQELAVAENLMHLPSIPLEVLVEGIALAIETAIA